MASEATSKNFLGEHAPRPPQVLHAYEIMHAYWHAHFHVNPPSENPGYRHVNKQTNMGHSLNTSFDHSNQFQKVHQIQKL